MIDARKISELPETNIMKNSSCMPIVQDGETRKIYFADLKWLFKGDKGEPGEKGEKGDTGVSIDRITVEESDVEGGENKITILKDNGQAATFIIRNGSKGEKGDTGAVATVVQNTGVSMDNVMSQKAVSDELSQLKGDLVDLEGLLKITNFIDLTKYEILDTQVTGTGSMELTYSYPHQKLYVMFPSEQSVESAKEYINKISNEK